MAGGSRSTTDPRTVRRNLLDPRSRAARLVLSPPSCRSVVESRRRASAGVAPPLRGHSGTLAQARIYSLMLSRGADRGAGGDAWFSATTRSEWSMDRTAPPRSSTVSSRGQPREGTPPRRTRSARRTTRSAGVDLHTDRRGRSQRSPLPARARARGASAETADTADSGVSHEESSARVRGHPGTLAQATDLPHEAVLSFRP